MEKGSVVIKLEKIPGLLRGIFSVIPLKGLVVDDDAEGNLYFHEVTYRWYIHPNDLHVICDLDGDWKEIGKVETLQDAIKLALEYYTDFLELLPEKKIKVIG